MNRLDGVFSRDRALKRPSPLRLPVEFTSFLTYRPGKPDTSGLPHGRGHRVLVLPGLMTTDNFTAPLRGFMNECGFAAHGWGLGVNPGPTPKVVEGIREQLDRLCDLEGGPVGLVGISMGGILARLLAHDRPEQVARLVSIVSPTRFPTASNAEPLVRLLSPLYVDGFDRDVYNAPPAMPTLAIHSRDDGLIAWESCVGDGPGTTSLEVSGCHTTICRNPEVRRAVVTFLAPGTQAEKATE